MKPDRALTPTKSLAFLQQEMWIGLPGELSRTSRVADAIEKLSFTHIFL
jgi:hypothetical protein